MPLSGMPVWEVADTGALLRIIMGDKIINMSTIIYMVPIIHFRMIRKISEEYE
jgi:hypothetical protein